MPDNGSDDRRREDLKQRRDLKRVDDALKRAQRIREQVSQIQEHYRLLPRSQR